MKTLEISFKNVWFSTFSQFMTPKNIIMIPKDNKTLIKFRTKVLIKSIKKLNASLVVKISKIMINPKTFFWRNDITYSSTKNPLMKTFSFIRITIFEWKDNSFCYFMQMIILRDFLYLLKVKMILRKMKRTVNG